jgi:hypothetical protein
MSDGRPSARSFTPTDKDGGHLSADRASLLHPKDAYERYLHRKQLASAGGTWGVSINEFESFNLCCYGDPLEGSEAHTLVDFNTAGDARKQQSLGKLVYAKAKARGRLHPPPDVV